MIYNSSFYLLKSSFTNFPHAFQPLSSRWGSILSSAQLQSCVRSLSSQGYRHGYSFLIPSSLDRGLVVSYLCLSPLSCKSTVLCHVLSSPLLRRSLRSCSRSNIELALNDIETALRCLLEKTYVEHYRHHSYFKYPTHLHTLIAPSATNIHPNHLYTSTAPS